MADATDQGMNAPSPPFAVADDLANRWHAFQESEIPHIDAVLADASDLIVTQCPRWRETSEATLKRITCAVAKRALLNEDTGGVTQSTQTAGSFSESVSYANPVGDLYLTKAELRSLGCGIQQTFNISLTGDAP